MRGRPATTWAGQPAAHRLRVAPRPSRAWLRARLLPGGENILLLAAYAMVLMAMLTTPFARRDGTELAPWRLLCILLALALLLALYVTAPDIDRWLGARRGERARLVGCFALFLLASWFDRGGGQFLPYLLSLLTAQLFVELPARSALPVTAALAAGWLFLVWTWAGSTSEVVQGALNIGSGMFFSALFALTITGYSRQTARAEKLVEDLRAADAQLASARERDKDLAVAEERVRLAREIHDGLGHHLTVLNVQLQAAGKLVRRDPDAAQGSIEVCRQEAQAALDEVRQSVAAMRRTPLDGRALGEALRTLTDGFDRHSFLRASFEQVGDARPLTPAAATTLYRAAQEGLTNAQKHATARRVVVTLDYAAGCTSLAVQDDGARPQPPATTPGFGLAGLRERAEQLGGAFAAAWQPGRGFRLELSVPSEGERS